MLPLLLSAVLWSGAGLGLGALVGVPCGSWAGLAVFFLQLLTGSWAPCDTPPRQGRFVELQERFGSLHYWAIPAIQCGQGPRALWLTRGFLEADLDHGACLERVRVQGWRLASRTLRWPAALRHLAQVARRYRLGGGASALDYLVRVLEGAAAVLEWPWRAGRPELPGDLLELAVRPRGGEPPAALESRSWAGLASQWELRRQAAEAAARGWRSGEPWPEIPRPGFPIDSWLPPLALAGGLVGALGWGLFGLPLLTWGLAQLSLVLWRYRPGQRLECSGQLVAGLDDLLSDSSSLFLDDGTLRREWIGSGRPGPLTARAWLQGSRLVAGGFWRSLLMPVAATLFGVSLTALWWLGI